ncbi:phenylalanine--tRNA ligase subunit beta [Candidatus Pacearchaeota archaeon]|nr:phenylalanine--tRNA ligase subunit beta [Candidatus Pacearchaeota archaeon]
MTILTVNKKELEKKVGKITKVLEDKITMMGTPVEEVTEDELSVEIFPNRPDLLSLGNLARAINQFSGGGKIANFKINKPEKDYVVTIDSSVKAVRPYTVCAIVKGLRFTNEKIKEMIDIQEKLHNSIGRKRKKLAIGIYPLNKISLPIRFIAKKPGEIKFLPLEARQEMTGTQILRGHPAGREYAHLLDGKEVFPIFIDANNKILSMPPIINSAETGRIDEKTREVFIECSGHNLAYLKKCMNIILATIDDMGGKIYEMNIKDSKEGNFVSPDMSCEELNFEIKNIEKTLGIKLGEKEIKNYLGRMGIGYENRARNSVPSKLGNRFPSSSGKGKSIALIPAYRTDILHWVDLTEEIAIAYGYENFKPEIPDISTIAFEDPVGKTKRIIGNILAGLGFLEASSFHLVTKKNIKKMHFDYNNFIEVEDSKTGRDVLRMDMLTNLLQVLSENSDAGYPQKIFEMGQVFLRSDLENSGTGVDEVERLAMVLINEKANFTELKQAIDYLFKMLGKEYTLENVENSNYILGRCGKVIVDGKDVGFIGEVAPRVLKNWKIKMPTVAMEIDLGFLFQ